jgi:hypothetical protein
MTKQSSRERQQLDFLNTLDRKVQHLHGLIERFASDNANPEQWTAGIRRSFAQLKLETSGEGYDAMSQLCGSMDVVAKRTSGRQMKIRIMREAVASLRSQIETEVRITRMAAAREQELEERREEAQDEKPA